MSPLILRAEPATPESVGPFGHCVGARQDLPLFAAWSGVDVYGPTAVELGTGGQMLSVQMAATQFPWRIQLLERHGKHTQTYLSANGRPFLMVLGTAERDGLPDLSALRAFLFKDGAGIVMHAGTWHEFPLAVENNTRFTVLLREESHHNLLTDPQHPLDARGPDLERYDIAARAEIFVSL